MVEGGFHSCAVVLGEAFSKRYILDQAVVGLGMWDASWNCDAVFSFPSQEAVGRRER